MCRSTVGLLLLLALAAIASPAAAQAPCFESPLPTVIPGEGVGSAVLPGGAQVFLWRATCDTSADRIGVLARVVPPGPSNPLACASTSFSFEIDGAQVSAVPNFPCPLPAPITVVVQRVCAQACPPLGVGTFAPDRQAVFAVSGATQVVVLPPVPSPPPLPTIGLTSIGCGPCAPGDPLTVQAVVASEVERTVEVRTLLQHPDGTATVFSVLEVELLPGQTIIPILDVLVPESTVPGAYQFQVRLLDPETSETVAIDRLRVERVNEDLEL